MKWEFAIAVRDEEDLERKKKGDILAYAPYPHEWGKREYDQYLIVIMDNLTEEEAQELCEPYFKSGRKMKERKYFNKKVKDRQGVESFVLELEDKDDDIRIAKRRHKIDLDAVKKDILPELDMEKVENIDCVYQPFKKEVDVKETYSKTSFLKGHIYNLKYPIDCGKKVNEEISIDAKLNSNLIIDKNG